MKREPSQARSTPRSAQTFSESWRPLLEGLAASSPAAKRWQRPSTTVRKANPASRDPRAGHKKLTAAGDGPGNFDPTVVKEEKRKKELIKKKKKRKENQPWTNFWSKYRGCEIVNTGWRKLGLPTKTARS